MSSDNFWSGAIVGALIFSFLPLGKEEFPTKTIYTAWCSKNTPTANKYSIYDCPDRLSISSTTYKVIIEKQEVIPNNIYWVHNSKRKCTVFDENNWRCEEKDALGSNWEMIHDGKWYSSGNQGIKDGTILEHLPMEQISATRYWWLYIKNIF